MRTLRSQWWLVLACVLVTVLVAGAYTTTRVKTYESTAQLLLQTDNLTSAISGAPGLGVDPTRQAATDAQLVALPAVAARVTRRLQLPLSTAAVHTGVSADTNLLTVTVSDHDPARAAQFANAFAREYIGFRRDTARQRYARALNTVRSRLAATPSGSPGRNELAAQAKQLRLLISLQTGDAQLIQAAVPASSAVSPRPLRNLLLALIVGLLLGFALAYLRERLDRRIKTETQLSSLIPGTPILGLIPKLGRRHEPARQAESFHAVEAVLRIMSRGRPLRSLLVTSAIPGEGKSTVALNLALARKRHGDSILLVDADLRRPSVTERLQASREEGVSSVLAGDSPLAASVQSLRSALSANGSGPCVWLEDTLSVVAAGPPAPSPQVLLNDRALTTLVTESKSLRELVIVDGPPIGAFSDMLPVAREVDGTILVVRLNHSRSDQLERLLSQLTNAGIEPIGVVLLGVPAGRRNYYAGYPYGY